MRLMHLCVGTLALMLVSPTVSPRQQPPDIASGGKLVGNVADQAENAPIRNAFVYIHGGAWHGDSKPAVNNAGHFEVSLEPGIYDIFIAAGGFKPTCAVVSIEANKVTPFDVRMAVDREHLENS